MLRAALLAILLAPSVPVLAEEPAAPERPAQSEPNPPAVEPGGSCRKGAAPDVAADFIALGQCYAELEPPLWDKTVTAYEQARTLGSVDAINRLGVLKERGSGGAPRDPAAAMALYRQAVERGSVVALNNVGKLYDYGLSVPADHAEARRWYDRAVAKGSLEALHNIGMQYDHARGVKQDREEALRWYRRAAEQDFAPSISNLGFAYRNGRGVEKNLEEARRWFEKAVSLDDANGLVNLGDMYMDGDGVPVDIARGIALTRRAAEKEQGHGLNNLGLYYYQGKGLPKDRVKAVALYRKAIEQKVPEAFLNLGVALNEGEGVERDQAAANRLFQRAAALGIGYGAQLYAVNLYGGAGLGEGRDAGDKAEARRWFAKAAAAGVKPASSWLVWMHLNGEGGPKSPGAALAMLETAGASGPARLLLASLLKDGAGLMKPDAARARRLFEAAAAELDTTFVLSGPWKEFAPLADAEDSRHDLAQMYEGGLGGPRSVAQARRFYGEAAEARDVRASAHFGQVLLDGGLGGKSDPARARRILLPAALSNRDDATAAFALARLLDRGIGGPENPPLAASLLLRAGMRGVLGAGGEVEHRRALRAIRAASPKTRALLRLNLAKVVEKGFFEEKDLVPWTKALGIPSLDLKPKPPGKATSDERAPKVAGAPG